MSLYAYLATYLFVYATSPVTIYFQHTCVYISNTNVINCKAPVRDVSILHVYPFLVQLRVL